MALRDPSQFLAAATLPIILVWFVRPVFAHALAAEGHPGATGAEQAVPGMTIMFSLFLVPNVGFAFFREHSWNTWNRLRSAWMKPWEVIAGKAIVPFGMFVVVLVLNFAAGYLMFGLVVRGSIIALALVGMAMAFALLGMGVLFAAACRTVGQLNTLGNLGALVFAGLGGALTPLTDLPRWAAAIAPITPGYWAATGFRDVIFTRASVGAVGRPIGILLAYGLICAIVAAVRFRMDERKVGWA